MFNAFQKYCSKGFICIQVICLIVANCVSSQKTSALNTSLIEAIQKNDLSGVQRLLDSGADADGYEESGDMPVVWFAAGEKDKSEILKLLIQRGANVNAMRYSSNQLIGKEDPILSQAVGNCNVEGTKILLMAGARVTSKVISAAVLERCMAAFLLLLEWPVDLAEGTRSLLSKNKLDKSTSVLGTAIFHGEYEMARLLIEKGAPLNNTNAPPRPIWNLISGGQKYQKNPAKPEGPRVKLLQYMLEKGAPIDSQSNTPGWCLSSAIQKGYFKIAEMLILAGADVNEWGYSGRPLDHALNSKNAKLIKMLKERGAVPKATKLPNDPVGE